jgi:hypothetical protein
MLAVLPHASVSLYVLIAAPEHPGFAESLIKVTVTVPPQLPISPVTSLIFGAGLFA